jgi:hypothetical protein
MHQIDPGERNPIYLMRNSAISMRPPPDVGPHLDSVEIRPERRDKFQYLFGLDANVSANGCENTKCL